MGFLYVLRTSEEQSEEEMVCSSDVAVRLEGNEEENPAFATATNLAIAQVCCGMMHQSRWRNASKK